MQNQTSLDNNVKNSEPEDSSKNMLKPSIQISNIHPTSTSEFYSKPQNTSNLESMPANGFKSDFEKSWTNLDNFQQSNLNNVFDVHESTSNVFPQESLSLNDDQTFSNQQILETECQTQILHNDEIQTSHRCKYTPSQKMKQYTLSTMYEEESVLRDESMTSQAYRKYYIDQSETFHNYFQSYIAKNYH